ncbi:DUF362 domain-containing protein [Desulfoferrobacter suflitae]|uniref:DUF362 domain-containing protein n=1 Tax=Desulfoferrobacter suflitae TaxID=2865782 RepID=UPI0021646B37|nr:DUF362 domain-containing protein [Desulfoferrobacter suflitae]MCK8600987.1 DUF362 domain-containing protein [Desulfoferrobacter suflitae]
MSRVTFVKTDDRRHGVEACVGALGINPVKGKEVLIKPNFNTADPTPGSTHNDTLMALVDTLWNMGARSISLGERSYPPTLEVMQQKGVIPLLQQKDVRILNFDDLNKKDWVEFKPKGSHWPKGFRIARPVLEAECLVSTCCLKTHQYGGVFTLSLKLHVGVVPTSRNGFKYMTQLHQSPHQRKMIAEINEPFSPQLVVMDAIDAFVDGGPMTGKRAKADAFLAATDRVALDAVGVALLKYLGSNDQIMNRPIFSQEQLARAVELGLGAASPAAIELKPVGPQSEEYCAALGEVLQRG